tara:strand:+ start:354 stop:479 length:126 start_codon:yes stop_codon:yes gene_type:complete
MIKNTPKEKSHTEVEIEFIACNEFCPVINDTRISFHATFEK